MSAALAAEAVPLTRSGFGRRLDGFPLADCGEAELAELRKLWLASGGLLILTGQRDLAPADFLRFCANFGPPERNEKYDPDFLLPGHPEILRLGNLVEDGRRRSLFVRAEPGEVLWHADDSFRCPQPAGSIFHCLVHPPVGGGTWFAGMAEAWDALPDDLRARVENRHAVHSYEYLDRRLRETNEHRPPLRPEVRRMHPPVVRPLVTRHPETERRALCIPECHIEAISGLDPAAARSLLRELGEHATGPDFALCHPWRPGEVAVWDNRSAMHAGSPFDEKEDRLMHRVTFAGPDTIGGRPNGAGSFGGPF